MHVFTQFRNSTENSEMRPVNCDILPKNTTSLEGTCCVSVKKTGNLDPQDVPYANQGRRGRWHFCWAKEKRPQTV